MLCGLKLEQDEEVDEDKEEVELRTASLRIVLASEVRCVPEAIIWVLRVFELEDGDEDEHEHEDEDEDEDEDELRGEREEADVTSCTACCAGNVKCASSVKAMDVCLHSIGTLARFLSRTALISAESPLQEAKRAIECWRALSILALSSSDSWDTMARTEGLELVRQCRQAPLQTFGRLPGVGAFLLVLVLVPGVS